ncbi:MAG: signal peptidase II [Gordonibacter sp.]
MSTEANLRPPKRISGRTVLVFLGAAVVWFCLDMLTKGAINGAFEQGAVITGPLLGLIRLHLVYNTGAAWGMFGDSTQVLAVMSLVVCIVLTAYLFFLAPRPSLLETVGVALVVAGGLGNAVDRFTLGYVVDFIEPVFIDFPIFNVADIGVTCGFVLFVLGMFLAYRRDEKEAAAQIAAAKTSGDAVAFEADDDIVEAAPVAGSEPESGHSAVQVDSSSRIPEGESSPGVADQPSAASAPKNKGGASQGAEERDSR